MIRLLCVFLLVGSQAWAADGQSFDCTKVAANAQHSNATDLLRYGLSCEGLSDMERLASMIKAQIRAGTDLAVLTPINEEEKEGAAKLYFAIFQYGGLGPKEFYADKDNLRGLVQAVNAWDPAFSESYNPGWKYQPITHDDYSKAITQGKHTRVKQIFEYYGSIEMDRRYSEINPTYKALLQQKAELEKQTNMRFVSGSEEDKRYQEIEKQIQQIKQNVTQEEMDRIHQMKGR